MVQCSLVSACGKAFASVRKLCFHEQKCTTCRRMAEYRCGHCYKMFSTPRQLKDHEIVHSDVKEFKCHICDKSFKRKGDCNRHVKEHSNVRNFKCHICERRFKQKALCDRHVQIHSGIKNFKCTKCGKYFFRYSNARSHEENCRRNEASVSVSYRDGGGELDLSADTGQTNEEVNLSDKEVTGNEQMDD